MMGDVQQSFRPDHKVRNFYSVSISGYHIAEAGANPDFAARVHVERTVSPIVEYYLARGHEHRRLRAEPVVLLQQRYGPGIRGHRSRRPPHLGQGDASERTAPTTQPEAEVPHPDFGPFAARAGDQFNDIRTTLQALYAIYDNCNSLHTNAYDEAITTPTEESVRRAMAIQLIINNELGLAKNENPLQGAFIIEELTDLVEEAVLMEFDRLSERGGVLGAMETDVPARQDPGGEHLLRDAQVDWRDADHRREHLPR